MIFGKSSEVNTMGIWENYVLTASLMVTYTDIFLTGTQNSGRGGK